MERIEVNVSTGEITKVQLTPEEISEIESRIPEPEEVPVNPVDKLKSFLSANPDVAEILK